MSNDRPIHAVPSGPDLREHHATGRCQCEPIVCRDLETPSRLVFLHQRQTATVVDIALPGIVTGRGASR
jgi:hypothetical protein